eukprot:TRINITY_DN1105_c0_g1_i2.p1 TRINITY_DN1105_c0_g1~~TRINITY_DN1105_c0_g1_i2.p1  ORF type:complete len:826 (-),score=182.12 TRINITY_DN1105_c0_g1_i2:103-2445(-)
MNSFIGFRLDYALLNQKKTGHAVYLHINSSRIATAAAAAAASGDEPAPTPSVLGIGVEGGFQSPEDTYEEVVTYAIVLLPSKKSFPYPSAELPMIISQSADAIIQQDSAANKDAVAAMNFGTDLKESQFAATLHQEPSQRTLASSGWTCEVCGGKADTNLWLNLSSGKVLCGRRNFDGSGGQGHANEHYQQHPNYPLAVKLGTITATSADIWSYPEDDMVIDPLLESHLAHWGLDMHSLKKTDKTIAELTVEHNNQFDWSLSLESGHTLVPRYGPGFTGLLNLGNTCYMNSVLQVLFHLPAFSNRYYDKKDSIFASAPHNPTGDLTTQLAKVADGLLSGTYCHPPPKEDPSPPKVGEVLPVTPPVSVRPAMLKALVGSMSPQFKDNGQKDAEEFMKFLLDGIHKAERRADGGSESDPSLIFGFHEEERLECSQSKTVRYQWPSAQGLTLPIPLECSLNAAEVAAYESAEALKTEEQRNAEKSQRPAPVPVRHRIRLEDCLASYFAPSTIEGWRSPATNSLTTATTSKKMGEFPPVLALTMSRFGFNRETLTASKMEQFLVVPETLHLDQYRGKGMLADEKPMPQQTEEKLVLDEGVIQQVMGMGFSRVRAERAAFGTLGQGPQAAIEWIFSHADDPDLDVPLPQLASSSVSTSVDEAAVGNLMDMGFSRPQCVKALKETQNNVERAVEWLFSHPDDNGMEIDEPVSEAEGQAPNLNTAPGDYRLKAFITHMGSNLESGHYVAHIRINDQWIFYNDGKVCESQAPPLELGYLYFYERQPSV